MNTTFVRNLLLVTTLVVLAGAFGPPVTVVEAAAPPTVPISQAPLTSVSPLHPQVLFAIGNSESMDGTLSGAIMAGSGALSSGNASLANSSSPTTYEVPPGFTPPVTAPTPCVAPLIGNCAPYTTNVGGTLVDNGASRLNVAKGGVQAILNNYMTNTDFGLIDYQLGGTGIYTTWVYYMSPPGGFAFTNTQVPGNRYVINPCFGYTTASSTVNSNCTSMAGLYGSATLATNLYMQIGASSDDPNINDVLYAGGAASIAVDYNGPSPSNPFTAYSLSQYNSNLGNIQSSYHNSTPGFYQTTFPTNAGYIPFSPQVMYSRRGFGYYGGQSASTGNLVVAMTSAGTVPTPGSVATAIAAFAAPLEPETNNNGSSEIKAAAGQASTPGLLAYAKTYYAGKPNPSGYSNSSTHPIQPIPGQTIDYRPTPTGCGISRYVILISDGLPTMDASGGNWPPLGSVSALGWNVTATFNADGSLNTTNDQALTDTITAITNLKSAGIMTYVVGLGAGVDPTLNTPAAQTLNAMAIAGGTYQPSFNNPVIPVPGSVDAGYLAATTPQALVTALNSILVQIQAGTQSTTSAAVNSASLITGTTIYQTTYTSSDTPYQDWTGNVLAYGINTTTGVLNTLPSWQANAQLDQQVCGVGVTIPLGGPTGGAGGCNNTTSNRLIATWNPATLAGAAFEWVNIAATQQSQLGAQTVLNYLRGDTSLEKRNGGSYRNRSQLLGDITDSNPIYVGAPTGPYSDASYATFVTTQAGRPPVIYVGANDGMLHAIDSATGNERFAFIPDGVFGNLAQLSSPLFNTSHHFFVDGSPTAGDALLGDGQWHTLLVGGEGAGGNTMFALDVTTPQNITSESTLASKVLWEFTDADMGLSYSQPAIARVNANTVVDAASGLSVPGFAVFFGNGYNNPSGHAILYAVHPKTGVVIAKIDLCSKVAGACSTSLPDGLSGVVAANANGLLGAPADMVYAGDLQGNLWAINVTDANPANWKVRVLFTATDSSNNPQPITSTPSVTLNPNFPGSPGLMVFVGTGQLLSTNDLSSTQTQSFYGVWDNCNYAGLLSLCTTAKRSNLQVQTITTIPAGTLDSLGHPLPYAVRTVSNNAINWASDQGWYMDLPGPYAGYPPADAAERVITSSTIENGGVVFTTDTPPPPPTPLVCANLFTSFLMDVNFINGGAFNQPRLGVGLGGTYVQVGGSNPVGIGLPPGFAAAPTIVGAGSSGYIYTQRNPNPTTEKYLGRQRLGWWQVQ